MALQVTIGDWLAKAQALSVPHTKYALVQLGSALDYVGQTGHFQAADGLLRELRISHGLYGNNAMNGVAHRNARALFSETAGNTALVASLADSPAAIRALDLPPISAEDQRRTEQFFRPYAKGDADWPRYLCHAASRTADAVMTALDDFTSYVAKHNLPTFIALRELWHAMKDPSDEGFLLRCELVSVLAKRPSTEWPDGLAHALSTLTFYIDHDTDFYKDRTLYRASDARIARLKILSGQHHEQTIAEGRHLLLERPDAYAQIGEIFRTYNHQAFFDLSLRWIGAGIRLRPYLTRELLEHYRADPDFTARMSAYRAAHPPTTEQGMWGIYQLLHGERSIDEVNIFTSPPRDPLVRYGGFMTGTGMRAFGEHIRSIITMDAAEVAGLGVTFDQLAEPLRLIVAQARKADRKPFTIEYAGHRFAVTYQVCSTGHEACPWDDYADESWFDGAMNATVTNERGEQFQFSGLLAHLIAAHHFCEGHVRWDAARKFRVEPLEAAYFFDIPSTLPSAAIREKLFVRAAMLLQSDNASIRDYGETLMNNCLALCHSDLEKHALLEQAFAPIHDIVLPTHWQIAAQRYLYLIKLRELEGGTLQDEALATELSILALRSGKSPDAVEELAAIEASARWDYVHTTVFGHIAGIPYTTQEDPEYLYARSYFFRALWELDGDRLKKEYGDEWDRLNAKMGSLKAQQMT